MADVWTLAPIVTIGQQQEQYPIVSAFKGNGFNSRLPHSREEPLKATALKS